MPPKPLAIAFALLVPALSLAPPPALATWPNSPGLNLPVCKAANNQSTPTSTSEGAGGVIITWSDFRSGSSDIYAQHVLASGSVDPAWPADGRAICTAIGNQSSPTIVSDGAGGAIIAWYDGRTGAFDIYAHHVLAAGVVDPAWPADGRALCTATNAQILPGIVTDGAGGAIVSWQDLRSGNYDVYVQRVRANGVVDPAWPVDGRALCTAINTQNAITIVADGASGAIVTWQDLRGANVDIYAQHVLANGAADPAWPVDGRAVCTATNDQNLPTIVTDGAGGAIIAWYDIRSGTNNDIYAHHVLASGSLDGSWPVNGRAVCTAANDQASPTMVSDGAAGAIVTWYDARGGVSYDIYAQHLLPSGIADPTWPVDGRAICTAAGSQYFPVITTDGGSGAIISWQDLRSGVTYDVYAQHILGSGVVDGTWPADGRALSIASGDQIAHSIVADGTGGAIGAWQDFRSGNNDIYAQRVARFGYLGTPEAEITGAKDVPNDNGGKIKLSWNASYLDGLGDPSLAAYDIYRSVPPNVAAARLARGDRAVTSFAAIATGPGRPLVTPSGAQSYSWEFVTSVNATHFPPSYSYLVPTAEDSTGYQNPRTAFVVVARNVSGLIYWPSRPDSGYSVDNLPPLAPAPFTGNYAAGAAHLHWDPNSESDLANYRLYRGSTAGFVPGPGNQIASPPDTGYADVGGAGFYYKLSAIDTHGNESGFALLTPGGTTDAGGPPALELALQPSAPNPASVSSTLRYSLPREAAVRLAIYDAGGRLIRTLASGVQPAGQHQVTWDLRDASGHAVGAGLYLVRLEVDGHRQVRRMTAMR